MFVNAGPTSIPTAKLIAEELGCLCVRNGMKYRRSRIRGIRLGDVMINYGLGVKFNESVLQTVNPRHAVASASDKLGALQTMAAAGVPVPEHSVNLADLNREKPIFGRSRTHTRGKDIEIIRPGCDPLYAHAFYVEYVKPRKEWRVHVFRGEIIFAQNKFRTDESFKESMVAAGLVDTNTEDAGMFAFVSNHVRNHSYGWRFNRLNDINNVPSNVRSASINAVDALGLDFGAVDVISYGRDENGLRRASVLEINTAPALEGESLNSYVQKFREC